MKCKGPINRLRMLRTRGLFGPLAQRVSRTLCMWSPGYAYGAGGALSGPSWPYADPYVCCDYSQATIEPSSGSTYTGTPIFTRSSTATVEDYQGNLVTVPADVPRFQGARWDGSQWHATTPEGAHIPGIAYLCEPAATNQVVWSEDLSQWQVGLGVAATLDIAVITPAGISGAYRIDASQLQAIIGTSAVNDSYQVRCFVKQGTASVVAIRCSRAGSFDTNGIRYDFATQQITSGTNARNAKAIARNNGWIELQFESFGESTAGIAYIVVKTEDANKALSGTIYVWGVHVERNVGFITSYIPTSGAAVTRAADDLRYLTGAPLADFSIQVGWDMDHKALLGTEWRLFGSQDSRGTNNQIRTFGSNSTVGIFGGGISQNFDYSNMPASQYLFAGAYQNANQKAYLDGDLKNAEALAWTPDHSNQSLQVGRWGTQSTTIPLRFSSFVVFDQALSDEQLQKLSSEPVSCPNI